MSRRLVAIQFKIPCNYCNVFRTNLFGCNFIIFRSRVVPKSIKSIYTVRFIQLLQSSKENRFSRFIGTN